MDYKIQENCAGIDWNLVREYLKDAGMGYYDAGLHRKAFQNSFSVVFGGASRGTPGTSACPRHTRCAGSGRPRWLPHSRPRGPT